MSAQLAKKFDRQKKTKSPPSRQDLILHNFLFPSFQKNLLRELREGLQQNPLFEVGDGSKISYLGEWGKGKNQLRYSRRTGSASLFPDHLHLAWTEFHWESNWKIEFLPNCCEVHFYPPAFDAGGAKLLSFDYPGLFISLGRWIEIRRFSYHHDDLFTSGSCLFVNERGTTLKLLRFDDADHLPEGLVPAGVSIGLIVKKVTVDEEEDI